LKSKQKKTECERVKSEKSKLYGDISWFSFFSLSFALEVGLHLWSGTAAVPKAAKTEKNPTFQPE
jgi:hypothetical protein